MSAAAGQAPDRGGIVIELLLAGLGLALGALAGLVIGIATGLIPFAVC